MRLGVKRQIWSLPAVAVAVFAIGIAVSMDHVARARALVEHVRGSDYPLLDLSKSLGVEVQRLTTDLNSAVAEGEKEKLQQAASRAQGIHGIIARIGKLEGEADTAGRLRREFDAYAVPAMQVARSMLGNEKPDPGTIAAVQSSIKALNEDTAKTTERAAAGFHESLHSTATEIGDVLATMIAAALGVLLAIVVVSWLVVRGIWRQLGGEPEYATRIVRSIAAGDLAVPIALDARDRGSQLAALKAMQGSLATLIENIRNAARNVRGSAAEIAAGMDDLSSRTEEQASLARGDGRQHAGAHRDRGAQRRARGSRARARPRLERGRRPRARGGARGRPHHGRDRRGVEPHGEHRRGDRRHRLPDQHPRPQRGGRGRARGRGGARLRGGRGRGAGARAAQRRVLARDPRADRGLDEARLRWPQARERGGGDARPGGGIDPPGRLGGDGDLDRVEPAVGRDPRDGQGRGADRERHAAERGAGRGDLGRRAVDGGAGRAAGAGGERLPARGSRARADVDGAAPFGRRGLRACGAPARDVAGSAPAARLPAMRD